MNLKKIYETYMTKEGNHQEFMGDYFNGDRKTIAVYNREIMKSVTNEGNINNNEGMHIPFFQDIISRKIGYMASDIKVKSADETLNNMIIEFNDSTKQGTSNINSIEGASVSGISHRLVYTDNGIVKIKNIPGWQVVYDYKDDVYNPDKAYYYYSTLSLTGEVIYHCDVYDKAEVTYYVKTAHFNDYQLSADVELNPQPHNFNQVPIFPFKNNSKVKGDCNDTIDIMNNYDFVLSDTTDELKATRLTYLKIWGNLYSGVDSDGNEIPLNDWLASGRAMIFGPDEEGRHSGDAEFLNKTVDDAAVQNMLKLLRTHIYEGSGSIDLKELSDNNNQRVFSIQAALSRLENNANVTEQYSRMALNKQYTLLFYWWSENGEGNYTLSDIEIDFTRNFVKDIAALVSILQMSMNVMDTEHAYALSGLFDNPKQAADEYDQNGGFVNGQ